MEKKLVGKSLAEQLRYLLKEIFQYKSSVRTPAKVVIDQKARQPKNFVSLDIEIAKVITGDFSQWQNHRPLGITCAAVQFRGQEPLLWYSKKENGDFAERMSMGDLTSLVGYLDEAVHKGWQVVTWNGLAFDFNVLAEESGCWSKCAELACNHIDMMFHLFCDKGYPLSLEKASKGMGLSGKPPDMTGELAPILWQKGEYQKVLAYVAQDARITLALALSGDQTRHISWKSNRGNHQYLSLPRGWLPVNQAWDLPSPNTSWMDRPLRRGDFTQWLFSPQYSLEPETVSRNEGKTWANQRTNELNRKNDTLFTPITSEHHHYSTNYIDQELSEKTIDTRSDTIKQSRRLLKQMEIGGVLECNCPICRSEPGEDALFKYLFCDRPEEREYYDHWDDYTDY